MGVLTGLVSTFGADSAVPGALGVLVYLAFIVVFIMAGWKVYEKAGEPGWKSIVPFYNSYTLFRIAGRNGWGFLLMLIPLVNIVVLFMVMIDLGKHFGKSALWSVFLLVFFSLIGWLILGFGDDEYVGTKHD